MSKAMILRLTREAVLHLSNPNTKQSLRILCRKFLDQHKL